MFFIKYIYAFFKKMFSSQLLFINNFNQKSFTLYNSYLGDLSSSFNAYSYINVYYRQDPIATNCYIA